MIGIFLFWLAFSPVQPAPERAAVPSQEQLQRQKDSLQQKRAVSNSAAEHIRRFFDRQLQPNNPRGITESRVISKHLASFYAARKYKPVWTKPEMVSELINAVDAAVDEGLDPSDYHSSEIREFHRQFPATPELQARYDLLLSDAFFTFASHLRYGKVDPRSIDPDWNLSNNVSRSALESKLENAIAAERIALVLKELQPQDPQYDQLRKELVRYRAIAREGGWPMLEEGPILKEGVRDRRVPILRERLEVSGDITQLKTDTKRVYNRELVEAVKRFQKRNGKDANGVLGASTVRLLNIPVERRIDQIRINLERYRWFLSELEPTYVMVNIPDFSLHYIENGHLRWVTRVIVGQPARKTPIFKADMQYIIFNPQWVIPPTILAKDALPGIRKNTSYLSHKRLKVINRNGVIVNPETVDWSQYTEKNFPFRLQQSSGDQGSLGRIKFMLPNKHIVYLHDTPNKELFNKSTRTLSSGCIRVQNPLELASLVLQDSVKWNSEQIREAVSTNKTKTVFLPKRIPVFIIYLTAFAENDDLLFRDDVYNRDNAVLDALNKPLPKF